MRISDEGLKQIIEREGQVLTMYRDSAGLPTIGVGHLLTRDELSSGKLWLPTGAIDWHQGLTEEESTELLRRDVDSAEAAIEMALATVLELEQRQFDTLVSFVFNVGTQAFRDSTLLKRLKGGQFEAVPEQLRRWIHAGGKVDPILVKRREDEIAQWSGA